MIAFVIPTIEQLDFRQRLLSDAETMAFNEKWGGAVAFPPQKWNSWYEKWVLGKGDERFYRYLFSSELNCFVGEAAWHFDQEEQVYLADILVHSQYRGRGYGGQALDLLCRQAKERGIKELRDHIALDNPSIALFLQKGFTKLWQDQDGIMVGKVL